MHHICYGLPAHKQRLYELQVAYGHLTQCSTISQLSTLRQCDMSHYMIQYTHFHIRLHSTTPAFCSIQHVMSPCMYKGTYDNHFYFICHAEVNIVTEKHLFKLNKYPASSSASDSGCWTPPVHSERRWKLTWTISSHTITITKFNDTNNSLCAIVMALLLHQKKVYNISKGMMTSLKSQLQMRPPQSRPLSKTGWISMVLPEWLSCWAWSQGFKQNTQSSTMRKHIVKASMRVQVNVVAQHLRDQSEGQGLQSMLSITKL